MVRQTHIFSASSCTFSFSFGSIPEDLSIYFLHIVHIFRV